MGALGNSRFGGQSFCLLEDSFGKIGSHIGRINMLLDSRNKLRKANLPNSMEVVGLSASDELFVFAARVKQRETVRHRRKCRG